MNGPKLESDYDAEIGIPVTAGVVGRILDARPASWLDSFLRLATRWAGAAVSTTSPWFRLGPLVTESGSGGKGAAIASFVWFPHDEGELFTSFRGRFVVQDDGVGSILRLEGAATGGTERANERVLTALVESLGSALTAGQGVDG